jgi:hypothetical protein
MSALELGSAVLIGAAGLAVWVDLRLGDRCPRSIVKVLMHGAGAFITVRLVATLAPQIIDPESRPRTMLALCLIVLSGWIYAFLVSIWAMKLIRSAMPR